MRVVRVTVEKENDYAIDVSWSNGFLNLSYTGDPDSEEIGFQIEATNRIIEAIKRVHDENAGL